MSEVKSYRKEREDEIRARVTRNMATLCADIVKQAQDNANQAPPGHPQVQSGTMRRSITMDVKTEGADIVGYVGIMRGKGEGSKALEYAPFIEFGTSRMPPYPFLFPAVEIYKGKVGDYLKR